MSSIQLTVGGFTQPGVARGLIEMPANAEMGFSPRFLWFFPNPLFEDFSSLGEVDRDFVQKISKSTTRYPTADYFHWVKISMNTLLDKLTNFGMVFKFCRIFNHRLLTLTCH